MEWQSLKIVCYTPTSQLDNEKIRIFWSLQMGEKVLFCRSAKKGCEWVGRGTANNFLWMAQCRHWSDCSFSLIWLCLVCPDLSVWHFNGIIMAFIINFSRRETLCGVTVSGTDQASQGWWWPVGRTLSCRGSGKSNHRCSTWAVCATWQTSSAKPGWRCLLL